MCAVMCDVCVLLGQGGSTPLLVAVAGSHDTIVKALLAAQANVNAATTVCIALCLAWLWLLFWLWLWLWL